MMVHLPSLGLLGLTLNTMMLLTNIVSAAASHNSSGRVMSPEDHLVEHLLSHYRQHGTVARPIKNSSLPISVMFGIRIINVGVLEKEQTLKLSVWCRIRWYDEWMIWDPADYGGMTSISLPYKQIWTPEIDLANTADTEKDERATLVEVRYNGRMFWTPHRTYESGCLIDITDYPYDQHTCSLWFQSLGIKSKQLDIQPYTISVPFDLDTYMQSYKMAQEWDLLNNVTERFEEPREEGAILMFSRRPALRFQITLRRRVGFKAYVVMVPCLLLSFMCCVVFVLPPERPDRHMLAMGLFGSFVMLLLILVETAPPSAASVPRLGYYYGCSIVLIILSVFCSAFVIFISRRVEVGKAVPFLIKKIFVDALGTALCMNWRKKGIANHQNRETQKANDLESEHAAQRPSQLNGYPSAFEDRLPVVEEDNFVPQRHPSEHSRPNQTLRWLAKLDGKLRKVESILTRPKRDPNAQVQQDIPMSIRLQWKMLTVVLDRLFIILFFVLNVVALVVFYPRRRYEL